MDKIVNKTICLQNYTLSIGNCKGLARACENFDEKVVNRIYLDNCGVSGREFKEILTGLANLKDCKSIIYHKNEFESNCLEELSRILSKRIPYHLDELKLVDLKIQ